MHRLTPTFMLLLLAPALATASPPVVGTEVVATNDALDYALGWDDHQLEFGADGFSYLGSTVGSQHDPGNARVHIRRGPTGSQGWADWGEIPLEGATGVYLQDMHATWGTVPRLHILYLAYLPSGDDELRMASTPLDGSAGPTWTTAVALAYPNQAYLDGSFCSDAALYNSHYLYVLGRSRNRSNGALNVWFSRSTDQGGSFEAPYIMDGTFDPIFQPDIAFGGGSLHATWNIGDSNASPGDVENQVMYRRSPSFANGGQASWEPVVSISGASSGTDDFRSSIVAHPASGDVHILYREVDQGVATRSVLRRSPDSGTSWPVSGRTSFPDDQDMLLLRWDRDGAGLYMLGIQFDFAAQPGLDPTPFVRRAPGSVDPQFGPEQCLLPDGNHRVIYHDLDTLPGQPEDFGTISHNSQFGPVQDNNGVLYAASYMLDAGFPNYQFGFPIAIPGSESTGSRTSPALVDLDDDGQLEIVFGNVDDGQIFVVEPDGSFAPGWPVSIGSMAGRYALVAVGDLNGDGVPLVVAGTATGEVHAFRPDGSPAPGFPVDLGTGAPAWVAIGALGPPYPLWIAAASGSELRRINYRGELDATVHTMGGDAVGPPAIGNLDGTGEGAQLVVVAAPSSGLAGRVELVSGDLVSTLLTKSFAQAVNAGASLGDLDLDGDLEIAVPTTTGRLRVFHDDGIAVTGFPFDSPGGSPLTPVAITQMLGNGEPELVFAGLDSTLHLLYADGTEQSGYPATVGGWGSIYGGPTVAAVNTGIANSILTGSRNRDFWAYYATSPSTLPGWPVAAGERVEVSPAAGDIDGDGRNELVFLGNSRLHVFDVGVDPDTPNAKWAMAGADPQRTSCSGCNDVQVTSVGPAGGGGLALRVAQGGSTGPTVLSFELADPAVVELSIYDARGRHVGGTSREPRPAGTHRFVFEGRGLDGARLARGHYFARLVATGPQGVQVAAAKLSWLR